MLFSVPELCDNTLYTLVRGRYGHAAASTMLHQMDSAMALIP